MRKLYYNIEIIRTNEGELIRACGFQFSKNQGFLKIERDEKEIRNIEGLLICDYLCSEERDNNLFLNYYIPDEDDDFQSLRKDMRLILDAKELKEPIDIDCLIYSARIQIKTISEVTDEKEKRYCDVKLEEFKESMFFKRGGL